MTQQEKAREIYKDNLYDCEVRGVVQDEQEILFMLEKMAQWKQQQMIEKAVKWLKDNAGTYHRFNVNENRFYYNYNILIDDFEKAMEECLAD